jgi:hypothetical protein
MQVKESNKFDQKLIDRIIKVAYGDAGIIEWFYIRFRALTNSEINSLLKEYKNTATAVHNLKQEDVPKHIIEKVNNYTTFSNHKKPVVSVISYGLFTLWNKKAIPATVLEILIAIIISFLLLTEPVQTSKYSKAEIELAEKQLKQSLAIVGKAFQKAENDFSNEILNKQVNKNLNRGYYLVNNILIGG